MPSLPISVTVRDGRSRAHWPILRTGLVAAELAAHFSFNFSSSRRAFEFSSLHSSMRQAVAHLPLGIEGAARSQARACVNRKMQYRVLALTAH